MGVIAVTRQLLLLSPYGLHGAHLQPFRARLIFTRMRLPRYKLIGEQQDGRLDKLFESLNIIGGIPTIDDTVVATD